MNANGDSGGAGRSGDAWYDLFSRGARDWLRHNEKVRHAVRRSLPEIISGADVLGSDGNRTVQIPVRFLEHYRFRLRDAGTRAGVGQGDAKPGDVLSQGRGPGQGKDKGAGGSSEGGLEFVLELKIDDIVDWLWEELKLPNLQSKAGAMEDDDYTREGWDRHGARSRLDRRRSLKESIKRRAVQTNGPIFTNEDLRYRQLVKRQRPATQAVVFFALDVSSSMTERDRKLAKTFFFWVIQGLRRQYTQIEPVFVAHTIHAWEFNEEEFFQVRGQGGTVASTAFNKVKSIIDDRYSPARYNIYIFYSSDGDNFREDRDSALTGLKGLARAANYMGYVETSPPSRDGLDTEIGELFDQLSGSNLPVGAYALTEEEDVWEAIRSFFRAQVGESEAGK
jgi:sporulation protein YhbH